jgi:cell division protein FtsL
VAEGGVMRTQRGLLRLALAFAGLLAALSLVIWRQSRALEVLRGLDQVRQERAVLETERSLLLGRIQRLESRGSVVAVAGSRLGLRVPVGSEIVVLPYASGEGVRR